MQMGYERTEVSEGNFEKAANLNYETSDVDKTTNITLHNDNKLKVRQIHLDIAGNFNRRYSVSVKSGEDYTPVGISGDIYNLHFSDLDISNTDIEFKNKPLSSEIIQLRIQNMDDKPLEIKDIGIKYYTDKIILEAPADAAYNLYFGNQDAAGPNYDIEKYKEHIDKEPKDVCSLGVLQTFEMPAAKKEGPDLVKVFNIIIVIVAIGLVVLTASRLNLKKRTQ